VLEIALRLLHLGVGVLFLEKSTVLTASPATTDSKAMVPLITSGRCRRANFSMT